MKILGIGGLPRSGKDSLAELLLRNGYYGVSLGDIVRGVSRTRHADAADPISVANMTETANFLRGEKGADFALKIALEQFTTAQKEKEYEGLVVYSVRAPAEVDFILAHGGDLIWVETADEIRHQRHQTHMREGEAAVSFEEFKRQEALQWQPQPNLPAESQMNVSYVKQKATKTIVNNGNDFEKFAGEAKKQLGLVGA